MDRSRQRPPESQTSVWVRPMLTVFGLAVIFVLIVMHIDAVITVLLGLLAAGAIASLLRPVANLIPGPRGLSAALTVVAVLAILAGIGWLLWWSLSGAIQQQIENWPQMQEQIDRFFLGWAQYLGLEETITVRSIMDEVAQFIGGGALADVLGQVTELVTTALIWVAFIFFGTLYLLAENPQRLRRPIARLLPPRYRSPLQMALAELEPKLRWWTLGTLISMTVVGLLAALGFWVIGLEFWLALAVLAAAGEIVPIIGPSVAFLTALLFAAAQGGNVIWGVLAVWGITQTLESNVIIPLVMRQAVRIPPVVTVFTVVLWARAFGPAGLLLAVPINIAVWVFVRYFIYTRRDRRAAAKGKEPPKDDSS